jgi:hypothetical protein
MDGSHPTEACPRHAASLELNDAEDGLVVYDAVRQTVHHLNPTASMIFELCDGTHDVDAIARQLAEAYRLEAPPAEDAQAAIAELAERHLITWKVESAPQAS